MQYNNLGPNFNAVIIENLQKPEMMFNRGAAFETMEVYIDKKF